MDVSKFKNIVEFPIDFKGQELVEKISLGLITFTTVISLAFSYLLQDITYTIYVSIPFVLLTFLVCLPPYSKFNENPVKFLERPKTANKIEIDLD